MKRCGGGVSIIVGELNVTNYNMVLYCSIIGQFV